MPKAHGAVPSLASLPSVIIGICGESLPDLQEAIVHYRDRGARARGAALDRARDQILQLRAQSQQANLLARAAHLSRSTPEDAEALAAQCRRVQQACQELDASALRGQAAESLQDPDGWRLLGRWGSNLNQLRVASWHLMTLSLARVEELSSDGTAEAFDPALLNLAGRLRDFHANSELAPAATEAEIRATEKLLGFRLPTALRCMYLNVANGGFGPGLGGVIGAVGGSRTEHQVERGETTPGGTLQWLSVVWDELDIAHADLVHRSWDGHRDPKVLLGADVDPDDPRWFEPFDDPWPRGYVW